MSYLRQSNVRSHSDNGQNLDANADFSRLGFEVLSEQERTALVYTLLQHSTQEQVQFFSAVLQQMKPGDGDSAKPKSTKTGVRTPSNIPSPDSPGTPADNSTSKVQAPAFNLSKHSNTPVSPLFRPDGASCIPGQEKNWASMVDTPVIPMHQKSDSGKVGSKGPGLAAINSSTLNLLATSGLSNDAQLLAVQLVMDGILQPADISSTVSKQEQTHPSRPTGKGRKASHGDWRPPSSGKYPSSALRSRAQNGVPKSSDLKSSGLASSDLDNASNEHPRLQDFDPALLNDISTWLKGLRLHKYTSCFEAMSWREMVIMDDAALEKKGVAALGARRRLLRTFDHVRREMGMQPSTDSVTPTTSAIPSSVSTSRSSQSALSVRQSAAPRLSADSPVFMPTGKMPQSAASVLQPAITSVI
jgi:hypothetical protein